MSTYKALWRKQAFQTRNYLNLAFTQSRLKQTFVLSFAILFELVLLLIFRDGFRFLSAFGGAGVIMISRIFALFFLGLAWMLLLSGLVSAYATFFSSPEIPFLLVRPFHMHQIVLYSFVQAASLSSWAFFVIVIPFVGAYAWFQQLHPLFMLWTLLFSIPFLFLTSSAGALIVLIAVRWLPKPGRIRIFLIVLLATIAGAVISSVRGLPDADTATQFNLATILPGMRMAVHPLSPSHWMAEGIMALTRGQTARGILYFVVLTSTAIMMGILVEQIGGRIFYKAWQRARTADPVRRRPIMLAWLQGIRKLLPADIAAIINKDIRTFFRDPAQWSQALVFFGLLGLYFSNLRTFRYDILPEQWRSAITFLNTFAVSAVLSSMAARFIYPQLSLEGHSFWMLGLSPATMPRILTAKFLVALTTTSIVSFVLIYISTRMLDITGPIQHAALAIILAVCLAVCGLSVGLGAIFLDLNEHNTAAIVSSFGGTLNIVLCLTFMLAAILPFGVIFHLQESSITTQATTNRFLPLAYLWITGLTVLATALPLVLANRSLRKRDF